MQPLYAPAIQAYRARPPGCRWQPEAREIYLDIYSSLDDYWTFLDVTIVKGWKKARIFDASAVHLVPDLPSLLPAEEDITGVRYHDVFGFVLAQTDHSVIQRRVPNETDLEEYLRGQVYAETLKPFRPFVRARPGPPPTSDSSSSSNYSQWSSEWSGSEWSEDYEAASQWTLDDDDRSVVAWNCDVSADTDCDAEQIDVDEALTMFTATLLRNSDSEDEQ